MATSPGNRPVTASLSCSAGAGQQLQTVLASCSCLLGNAAAPALRPLCRGEAVDCYVPQSVMTSDGHVLDVDIVLNEMFKDGDELHVEYSAGPKPFAARRGNVPLWSGSAGSEAPAAALWLADVWDMW